MIKKRTAKTGASNQRIVSRGSDTISDHTSDENITNENDQQTVSVLLSEKHSIVSIPTSKKSNNTAIDFLELYGSSQLNDENFKLNSTLKYQPREKRNTKQNATFSTSDLKKRKRNLQETHTTNEPIVTTMVSVNDEDLTVDDQYLTSHDQTEIPDDITIQAIKMKRKKIRDTNNQETCTGSESEEYIPIEYMPDKPGLGFASNNFSLVMKNGEITLHKNREDEGRLVREDDFEDNIDEIINRNEEVFESWKESKIMFGKPNDDRNKGDQKESYGDIEMDDAESAEDEEKCKELTDFEMKQMRNAGLYLPENTSTIFTQNNLFKSTEEIEREEMLKIEENRMLEESINRFDSKNNKLIESFEIVENQLLERMKELEISHSSCMKVVLDTNTDIEHCAKNLSQLNEDIDQHKEQYEYFQEMGRFTDTLSDLLDTKLPEIEIIESQIIDIQERYYRQIFEKSFHGHVSFMTAYREDQYERAASFGGDGTVEITYDRFLQEISVLVEKMKNIFNDVDEDYCSLHLLKSRFEGWKAKYPSLYRDTYCSLCLQKVFSIFSRYELFTTGSPISFNEMKGIEGQLPAWSVNPLLSTSFSVFEFWKTLFNYGENIESDEEETILPDIIRKTIFPFILHTISKIYNPMDFNQTRNAIEIVKEYKVYLLSSNTNDDKKIMDIITEKLKDALHNFKFPSIVQDVNLVEQYLKQCISIISESVLPWFEIYPPLNGSEKLAYHIVHQLINTKLVSFIDYCVSKSMISGKEKIKYLSLITQCKLPIHWRRDLNLSID